MLVTEDKSEVEVDSTESKFLHSFRKTDILIQEYEGVPIKSLCGFVTSKVGPHEDVRTRPYCMECLALLEVLKR
jgi:hypothetical protein